MTNPFFINSGPYEINQLLNNLEMELGAPFPKNNKDDIILDILPGKVGNLRIKGLNFY